MSLHQQQNLLQMIQRIKTEGFTKEIQSKFSKDELAFIAKILNEIEKTGRSDTLDGLWDHDYISRPVSIDEFLDDDYYLGKIGKDLYPTWRSELRHVFSPYSSVAEWIIKGSIGTGKTTIAVVGILYKIHCLLCLHSPQKFYGLVEGTPVVFGLFNIYKYLAQATAYQYLVTWMRDLSPYFRQFRVLGDDKKSKWKRFPLPLKLKRNASKS